MALKVPNGSEIALLTTLKDNKLNGAKLRLFKNNITPADTDNLATYTQADFPGYAEIALTSWGTVGSNGVGKAQVDETNRTFNCTSNSNPNSVYGYYVTDSAGTTLLFAERDPNAPIMMDASGKTYTVLPRLTLSTES